MFEKNLLARAEELLAAAQARGWRLATAESCTGGLISGCLTAVPGSSTVFLCGFVTYDNAAKSRMLGVPAELIARDGAVSETVAQAMAEGAIAHSPADLALACTGVAGPGGGTLGKPVGLVHIAAAVRGGATRHLRCDYGDRGRDAIRAATIADAIGLALEMTREPGMA